MTRCISWRLIGGALALIVLRATWMAYQSPAFAFVLNGLSVLCQ